MSLSFKRINRIKGGQVNLSYVEVSVKKRPVCPFLMNKLYKKNVR